MYRRVLYPMISAERPRGMMGYWRAPRSVAYISTDVHVSNEPLPLWGELARTTASQWGM